MKEIQNYCRNTQEKKLLGYHQLLYCFQYVAAVVVYYFLSLSVLNYFHCFVVLTSSVLVPHPKNYFFYYYTVVGNSAARGLLNREKRAKEKV